MEKQKNEILILETAKRILQVTVDGDLLKITDIGKAVELSRVGVNQLISNFSGKDNLLTRCKTYKNLDDYTQNRLDDYKKHRQTRMMEFAKERENHQKLREMELAKEKIIFEKRLEDLLDNQPIPTTRENLRIIMKWLNTHNWGTWQLPTMTTGYSAHPFDCDGRSAVTITLDKPLDGVKKYKYNAPAGHLKNYTRI